MTHSLHKENCFNLLSQAGPVVRLRTTTEIKNEKSNLENLKKEVLKTEQVQYWLRLLNPRYDRNMHGSKSDSYENVMGKIYNYGIRKGTPELDNRVQPFLDILKGVTKFDDEQYMGMLYKTMIAGFLSIMGYSDHEEVQSVIIERLDRVYEYVKYNDLSDFYVSRDTFKHLPKPLNRKKLVNPKYYDEKGLALPLIYDMLGFLHCDYLMDNSIEYSKVEKIVKLVFSEDYQLLPEGYGYVRKSPSKFYAMGWSVHLPLFFKKEIKWSEFGRFLLYLELFRRFKYARKHTWYKESLDYLGQFIGEDGVPVFPGKGMPEKKVGYWVSGARLGLEFGRRYKKLLRKESAFRYLLYSIEISQKESDGFM